jgi:hypothetical protein
MGAVLALRRVAAAVGVCLASLLLMAAPASAHTVAGQGATNYRTTLGAITPPTPGLRVKVLDAGSLIELRWTGTYDLIVLGYGREPYLRLGPEGVYRNRLSTATYLNVTRTYGAVPSFADDSAPPQWVKLSSGHVAVWHDHRIHWMGAATPPDILAAPKAVHLVDDWQILLTSSRLTAPLPLTAAPSFTINGTLQWVPGPSPWPWTAVLVVLAAVGVGAALTRRWAGFLASLLVALIVVDVVHAVGTGFDQYGSLAHKLLYVVVGSYYSMLAWVVGVIAIRLLRRHNTDGLFAAIFTGLVIGLFGGAADVVALARSQVPFLWGPAVDRGLIAVSCGAGAGVFAGAVIAYRRHRPAVPGEPLGGDLLDAVSGSAP